MEDKRISVNGVKINPFTSFNELLDHVVHHKGILVAINAEKILHATPQTRDIINRNIGYCDGIGAVMALRRHGQKQAVKLPGCELWLKIIAALYKDGKRFYLVGSKQEVIEATVAKLKQEFAGIDIVGYRNGYIKTEEERKALIDDIAARRPDYKVMVNWILNYIQAMSDNFIAVDPYSNPERRYVSLNGIREALMQAKNGHPLGFFPAGAVSRLKWSLKIEDREWQPNIIRLIQQIKKPVIPVFFHGHNSLFYNLLGLISWKLRAMRLPAEVFKKEHQTIHVSFGDIIPPETLAQYRTTEELGAFLRHETDKLRKPKSRL